MKRFIVTFNDFRGFQKTYEVDAESASMAEDYTCRRKNVSSISNILDAEIETYKGIRIVASVDGSPFSTIETNVPNLGQIETGHPSLELAKSYIDKSPFKTSV